MMAGWVFLVLTGTCQFDHGLGGFTTNFIQPIHHHPQFDPHFGTPATRPPRRRKRGVYMYQQHTCAENHARFGVEDQIPACLGRPHPTRAFHRASRASLLLWLLGGCRRQLSAQSRHNMVSYSSSSGSAVSRSFESASFSNCTRDTHDVALSHHERRQKSENARTRMGAQPTEMANDARSTPAHCTTRSELDASLTSSPRRGSARDGRCRGKGSHLGHLVLGQLEAVAHFIARL